MKNKRKPLKKIILLVGGILALAIIAGAAFFLFHSVETKVISDPMYLCCGGVVDEYPNGVKLRHTKKGTQVIIDGTKQDLSDFMLYYEGQDRTVLQTSMIWNQKSPDTQKRISYFSEVSMEDGIVVINDGENEYLAPEGFLYNGKDTYLFLEPCELTVNGEVVSLSALSSITVYYRQEVDVYNYAESAAIYYDTPATDVTVTFSDGSGINLSTDSFELKNGSWYLLPSDPNAFQ